MGEALAFAAILAVSKFNVIFAFATIDTHDTALFIAVAALLGAVAVAAMMVPAHRAANCEPLEVLREE